VCDAACGILSIYVSSRKDNLNICFASAFPNKTGLMQHLVYRNFTATFSSESSTKTKKKNVL